MNNPINIWRSRVIRSGLAVLSAALITAGAWQGLAAGPGEPAAPENASAQAARPLGGVRSSYSDVVKVASPAVVTIRVEGRVRVSPTQFPGGRGGDDEFRRFFGDRFGFPRQMPMPRQHGLGSGVIVSADGYVLTNHHVVDGADRINVELVDGRSFDAERVGSDEPSDLAVLKVKASNLPFLTLGDSDAVEVGDVVLAVGNPLNVGQTVTMGIVSAKGRSTGTGDGSYEDFLQTDAPINQGNSGGALVNTKGELVGINTQILSPSGGNIGIGFAIPANMARHVMKELKDGGSVRRAQLGVTVQPVTSDLAESLGLKDVRGAIVSSVAAGSAAERAGIRQGDVIVGFDGHAVDNFNSLRNRVAAAAPGKPAELTLIRDGAERKLNVTLDEASRGRTARASAEEPDDNAALGVAVAPLTPELAAQAGVRRDVKGLLVQEVRPDSRAADAGLQPGDVIVQVDRKPVQTVDDLRAGVNSKRDKPVLMLVNREGQNRFLTVRPSTNG
jgi:Do/DeqQ family serine protease